MGEVQFGHVPLAAALSRCFSGLPGCTAALARAGGSGVGVREWLSARRTPRLLCARVESTRLAPVARYNFRVSQCFGRGTR